MSFDGSAEIPRHDQLQSPGFSYDKYLKAYGCEVTSGYLDLVQRLEFGVDHLQKNPVYQIE